MLLRRLFVQLYAPAANISLMTRVCAKCSPLVYTLSYRPLQTLCPTTTLRSTGTGFTGSKLCYSTENLSDPIKMLDSLVHSHRIVILMKGNPDEPRCGFSNAVCRILEMHGVLDKAKQGDCANLFASYDVLASDDLRTAAKQYADWPTFPQVYFDGEFVGGCDILLDMHRSGKLSQELERLGIGSTLADANKDKES